MKSAPADLGDREIHSPNRRLYTLLDLVVMLERFPVNVLLHELNHAYFAASGTGIVLTDELKLVGRGAFIESLKGLQELCAKHGLYVPMRNFQDLVSTMEVSEGVGKMDFPSGHMLSTFENAIQQLKYAVEGTYFMQVDSRYANFMEDTTTFGPEIDASFSRVGYDIRESLQCYALNRWTATVFHCMRILEAGLRALHIAIGLHPVTEKDRDWGSVIRRMREKLADLKKNGLPADQCRVFEELIDSFDSIRRSWRNPTMHIENRYDEAQSGAILIATGHFMRELSMKFDQEGTPFSPPSPQAP